MGKNRQKANLTSNNLITSDITNDRIGINSTSPTTTLDVGGTITASEAKIGSSATPSSSLTTINTDGVNISGIVTATTIIKSGGTSSQFLKADGSVDSSTYLTSFTETNDLSSAVTWANVPNANITQGSVTQHQAALSITESQISDLQSYLTSYTETDPVVAAINGIVKSNGSTISAATAGTDYLTPSGDGSSLTGVLSDVVEDTTPQLGGNLDLNSNHITGTGNMNVTGIITATSLNVPGADGINATYAIESDQGFYTKDSSDSNYSYSIGPSIGGLLIQSAGGTYSDIKISPDSGGAVLISGIASATSFNGSASNMTGLTGASAGTYGNSTTTPVITVDANGRITTISTASISGGGGGGSGISAGKSIALAMIFG